MADFIIFLVIFLVLVLVQIPIVFSIGIATCILMLLSPYDLPVILIAQRVYGGADSFILLAIPLFILSGNLMKYGGMSRRMVNFINIFIGRFKGGMSLVMVGSCMLFAGVSGSAVADCAAVGGVMLPALEEQKYPKAWVGGLLATAGTIGPIIPPSVPLIIYGVTAGVSIADLFLGGIIPGIIIGLGLMAVAYYYAVTQKFPTGKKYTFKESLSTFYNSVLSIGAPVIIIGGIVGGVCTPTEAGALASVYALFVGTLIYREIKLRDFSKILRESVITSSIVVFLIAVSTFSAWLITILQIPNALVDFFSLFSEHRYLIFFIINLFLLLWGTIMDLAPTILILVPLLLPLLDKLEVNLVFFGVMMVINLCIGLITPPVGTVLYVVCSMTGLPPLELARKAFPFMSILILTLIIIVLFPNIVLFIPNLLR